MTGAAHLTGSTDSPRLAHRVKSIHLEVIDGRSYRLEIYSVYQVTISQNLIIIFIHDLRHDINSK